MPMICALLLWMVSQAAVVGPAYPPNAFAGGNVVAVLHVSSGKVSVVDILFGDAPFAEPAVAALAGWHLDPAKTGDVLVVVNFRTPTLYSVGSAGQKVPETDPPLGLAYPKKVVEPAYPANSLAEGSAVLKLALRDDGSVGKVKVMQGLGGMTDACVSAAGQWRFKPARSRKNAAVSSEAYAVFVVRRPIL